MRTKATKFDPASATRVSTTAIREATALQMTGVLGELLGADTAMSWSQECARALLVFFYGLLIVRVSGRRVFSRWSALDIIVSIVAGASLGRAMTGGAPLWGTLAAVTLLMFVHGLLAHAAARSDRVSRLLEGPAIRVATDGIVDNAALRANAISRSDLDEALRQRGFATPSRAGHITLEPSGQITVLQAQS